MVESALLRVSDQESWRIPPDLPEVRVLQGRLCRDALIWVIGQHLVQQRQGRCRTVGDQPGDTTALFRGEIETHRPGPTTQCEYTLVLP